MSETEQPKQFDLRGVVMGLGVHLMGSTKQGETGLKRTKFTAEVCGLLPVRAYLMAFSTLNINTNSATSTRPIANEYKRLYIEIYKKDPVKDQSTGFLLYHPLFLQAHYKHVIELVKDRKLMG